MLISFFLFPPMYWCFKNAFATLPINRLPIYILYWTIDALVRMHSPPFPSKSLNYILPYFKTCAFFKRDNSTCHIVCDSCVRRYLRVSAVSEMYLPKWLVAAGRGTGLRPCTHRCCRSRHKHAPMHSSLLHVEAQACAHALVKSNTAVSRHSFPRANNGSAKNHSMKNYQS